MGELSEQFETAVSGGARVTIERGFDSREIKERLDERFPNRPDNSLIYQDYEGDLKAVPMKETWGQFRQQVEEFDKAGIEIRSGGIDFKSPVFNIKIHAGTPVTPELLDGISTEARDLVERAQQAEPVEPAAEENSEATCPIDLTGKSPAEIDMYRNIVLPQLVDIGRVTQPQADACFPD